MSLACRLRPYSDNPIQDLSSFVDCQAAAMAHGRFAEIGHGVLLPGLITTALTLFVALIGYRLLLGRGLSTYDLTIATLKVGLVLSLTMGWSAYDTLVYRVATLGPLELVDHVMGMPSDRSGLSQGLDRRFQSVVRRADQLTLTLKGVSSSQSPDTSTSMPEASPTGNVPPSPSLNRPADPFGAPAASETFWNRPTRTVVMGSFGALLAIKLVIGALLGLGPIFILFALFDVTLGICVGWLRSLIGSALALSGLTISCLIEISYFETLLAQTATDPSSSIQNLTMGTGLATFVFTLTPLFFVIAAYVAGFGLQIAPQTLWRGKDWGEEQSRREPSITHLTQPLTQSEQQSSASRIRSLSDAVDLQMRRDVQRVAATATGTIVGVSRREVHTGPALRDQGPEVRRSEMTFRSPSTIRRDGR